MITLLNPIVCGCGKKFESVPATAKEFHDSLYGGYYFDCTCGSTFSAKFKDTISETFRCPSCFKMVQEENELCHECNIEITEMALGHR